MKINFRSKTEEELPIRLGNQVVIKEEWWEKFEAHYDYWGDLEMFPKSYYQSKLKKGYKLYIKDLFGRIRVVYSNKCP